MNAGWRRVTRRYPCPICAATGWCVVSINGDVCLCMRTESDWPAKRGMGGHFHRLQPGQAPRLAPQPRRVRTVFDRRKQSTVSEWILGALALDAQHEEHLAGRQRRLDRDQVRRRGYRTWPALEDRQRLATLAEAEFGALMKGFPGFYRGALGEAHFAGPEGLLLPVRNADCDIIGFQMRPDDATMPKRIWLSSAGRRSGTGSGAPPHWAWPEDLREPFTAYVVEGVLNADICSDKLGSPVIGLSGKTNWRSLDAERMSGELIERIVLALDQDGPESSTQQEALQLAAALKGCFNVEVAHWDGTRAKGFDDCLHAGLRYGID